MAEERLRRMRSASVIGATVLLGISWTFALLRVHTSIYPLFWAGAMPLLAFYYMSGPLRQQTWKHLPAAAVTIYAVVMWNVTKSYGAIGPVSTVIAVLASFAAVWFGARLSAQPGKSKSSSPYASATGGPTVMPASSFGSGVARRRRERSAGSDGAVARSIAQQPVAQKAGARRS